MALRLVGKDPGVFTQAPQLAAQRHGTTARPRHTGKAAGHHLKVQALTGGKKTSEHSLGTELALYKGRRRSFPKSRGLAHEGLRLRLNLTPKAFPGLLGEGAAPKGLLAAIDGLDDHRFKVRQHVLPTLSRSAPPGFHGRQLQIFPEHLAGKLGQISHQPRVL